MVDMPMEMQHQIMGYDRASTMFAPDGRMLQVEYAEKTVRLGPASIALICSDGLVIVADRRMKDKLIEQVSANRIFEIDEHIGATYAGVSSDGRVLIERAQLTGQQHRVTFNSPIEVESIIKEIADTKQLFTQYGGARPFGVSILVAGIDKKEARIFVSDVTGNYFSYKATAIGENDEKVKELLRKYYDEKMNIEAGIKLCFKIFKEVLGKNFEIGRFDVAYITLEDKSLKRIPSEELKKYNK